MNQLDNQAFALFKSECQKWIDLLGLKDWSVNFAFEHLESSRAECLVNWTGKSCTIVLGKFPKDDMEIDDVRKSAFHEVCELLLTDMEFTALDEAIPHDERKVLTEVARHGVIRRLENSVFKMGK
ncbi:hypothetical protein [Desulfovibrio piger]|uniref:hypothetical protein n=1 Tax=Desulfovibrio piger TaxID=901 RepID=UPI0026F0F64B|nr:hypothetical protein [Desulfovibrio piger]